MNYDIETTAVATICTPNFMKMGSGTQKLLKGNTGTQTVLVI
jgi:hypothetical protein